MAVEIEKKYRATADRIADVLRLLEGSGANLIGEDVEENLIYGGPPLAGRDAVLRLRKTGRHATLTYKSRIAGDDEIKRQIEEETEVSDAMATQRIISELGLTLEVVYEKKRKTWRVGSVELMVDELPFGWFIEIEGPEESIDAAERRLGLRDLAAEHLTYPQLAARMGKKVGMVVESRFEKGANDEH